MNENRKHNTIDSVTGVLERRAGELAKAEGKAGKVGKVIQASTHTYGIMSTLHHSDAAKILNAAAKKIATAKLSPSTKNVNATVDAFINVMTSHMKNPVQTAKAAIASLTIGWSVGATVIAILSSETGVTISAITPLLGITAANAKPIIKQLNSNAKILVGVSKEEDDELKSFTADDVIRLINSHDLDKEFIAKAKESFALRTKSKKIEKEPMEAMKKTETIKQDRQPVFTGFDDDEPIKPESMKKTFPCA